jgi:hypothetical protein
MKIMMRSSWIFILLFFSRISFALDQPCADFDMHQWVTKAKEEIDHRLYLTLATVDQHADPWNAPLYFAFDERYHFYWMSSIKSQHSKNIRFHSTSFVVIYDSTVPEGKGFGVYLRGHSYELNAKNKNEILHGIAVMGKRIHRAQLPSTHDYLFPFPRRIYTFIPDKIWINTRVMVQGKKVDKRLDISRCFLNRI